MPDLSKVKVTHAPEETLPRICAVYLPFPVAVLITGIAAYWQLVPYWYCFPLFLAVYGIVSIAGLKWWAPIRKKALEEGRATGPL